MEGRNFKNVIYEKDDETGIVTVMINRPEIKNALTLGVLLELNWAVDALHHDDTATAMILTGAKPVGVVLNGVPVGRYSFIYKNYPYPRHYR